MRGRRSRRGWTAGATATPHPPKTPHPPNPERPVMPILVLARDDVHNLLPPGECVEVMREALRSLAAGHVHQPLRMVVRPPEAAGLVALMPSFLGGDEPRFGLKAVCVFRGNPALGKDAHQGSVLLFDGGTGEPMALANGSAVTELRTAAVSAVATDALARPDAATVAVIGAGVQAPAHGAALAGVRRAFPGPGGNPA